MLFPLLTKALTCKPTSHFNRIFSTMSIKLNYHVFAGNPINKPHTSKQNDAVSPSSAFQSLKSRILGNTHDLGVSFEVLPFRKGRPLAGSVGDDLNTQNWHLGWLNLSGFRGFLDESWGNFTENEFVYLGSKPENDVVYWAVDVSEEDGLVNKFGSRQLCFTELRTLMVATDWANQLAMADLAIAGHARALLEWHKTSRFCGSCGEKTVPTEAGRRKQCSSEACKKRVYPRVDPVVIMLVIDKQNDRALLSRQSRFVPRMWSCLAGFIEPGESLEEAVRRETWEETGIEVGEVIYHSSQPWPVGPSSMPCQLMVGFFAYAKSFEINVDKEELEADPPLFFEAIICLTGDEDSYILKGELYDAKWHSREDIKKALTFAEYEKAQKTAAMKVNQMCKGVERSQSLSADFNVESGELAPMFVPGPYAIAHHLIASWANGGGENSVEAQTKQLTSSLSNL